MCLRAQLCGTGDWTQSFTHAWLAAYQLSYVTSRLSLSFLRQGLTVYVVQAGLEPAEIWAQVLRFVVCVLLLTVSLTAYSAQRCHNDACARRVSPLCIWEYSTWVRLTEVSSGSVQIAQPWKARLTPERQGKWVLKEKGTSICERGVRVCCFSARVTSVPHTTAALCVMWVLGIELGFLCTQQALFQQNNSRPQFNLVEIEVLLMLRLS